uniref:Uncharacterized protein n=1 Tax=Chromera velia CCMP2878 TaxID=1169474 RepID=A0A0G4H9M6_9ALVE|eukprot:Cvel_5993.t1-p1 / transcript=Cvel_5993.t1 / gene=Cvel_5993 / organism=Chromera_velia_CCMP2878 / gene_product=Uncharacterized monooxygenase Mb0916, putative / transcript_product=Uncharacterized monooxygenase Mb0916, putative / location=Cvel_scaffold287:14465-18402(+) / protein_length=560 / sequence_SO=supercontig / SO=protein_coding / is_pseudo=false
MSGSEAEGGRNRLSCHRQVCRYRGYLVEVRTATQTRKGPRLLNIFLPVRLPHRVLPAGCECDIPSILYSFSFAPKYDWKAFHAGSVEIQHYLETVVDKFEVRGHFLLQTGLEKAKWEEDACTWVCGLSTGQTVRANFLAMGVGGLDIPVTPKLPGREDFKGPQLHSQAWDPRTDVKGLKVGILGTGASAVQMIPEVAQEAKEVVVFQRSPNWIFRKEDWGFLHSKPFQLLFSILPILHTFWRMIVYLKGELLYTAACFFPSYGNRYVRWVGERFLRKNVRDPKTIEKLTPDYPPGCRRLLVHNQYLKTFNRPNVNLVTVPVDRLVAEGVKTTDGGVHEVDILCYATGFDPSARLQCADLRNGKGEHIDQVDPQHFSSFLGVCNARFPNLFHTLGANTALATNSVIWMIECQVEFIVRTINAMRSSNAKPSAGARGNPGGLEILSVEPKQSKVDEWMKVVNREFKGKVWGHCKSWYKTTEGVVYTLWPGYVFEYWAQCLTGSTEIFSWWMCLWMWFVSLLEGWGVFGLRVPREPLETLFNCVKSQQAPPGAASVCLGLQDN